MLEFFVIAVFITALGIGGFAFWIARYLLIVLPEQQKDILQRYSPAVVNQVALEYSTLSEAQQKQIAEEKMRDIFEGSGTPLPSDAMIEAAIGSAQYRQKQEEATLRLEALRDEIIRMQVSRSETISEIPVLEMPNTPRIIHTEGIERIQ